jgi:AcrR family transcriptional regulator
MCLELSERVSEPFGGEQEQLAAAVVKLDPRAEKTRAAVMRAFNSLVLSRGYDGLMPADVAEAAGVARSTLYEHFSGKEAMLRHSLLPILEPLAACVGSRDLPPRLEFMLEHIRSSRRMARELLSGRARTIASRALAALIEVRLTDEGNARIAMPRPLLAAYLASGTLGLLDEWLSGREACAVPVLARALHASTYAAAGPNVEANSLGAA